MTPSEERQLRSVAGLANMKPRLTAADRAVIMDRAGTLQQAKVGERVGASQSTVSRHLRKTASHSRKTGRHVKLTRKMLFAAARFQFIFNTT
jgi:DNA-binding transcriptional ArsR family regulator